MFINRNNNSKFTGTIVKYNDTISSITLDGNISITPNDDKQLKDVIIINRGTSEEIIKDWEKYSKVETTGSGDNETNYLEIKDGNTINISTTNDTKILYFRAQNGFIEYNNYGNVKIEGVGIFNAFNKVLYLQNGFLIRIEEKALNSFALVIKHPDV